MKKPLTLKLFVLMACLWCAIGAEAAEAYTCYTPSNKTLTFYYDNYRSSRTGTTYNLNTGAFPPDWSSYLIRDSIRSVVFNPSFANARPTSTLSWFYGMSNLQSFTGMNYLNTSEVTNMESMFYDCSGLTSLDVSNFNTSKVTDMSEMFGGCESLTSLDLSNFNTSKVTKMTSMFVGCRCLTSINLSNFNTSKVTDMRSMFMNCSALRYLDSFHFATWNVTDMSYMFAGCESLVSLDLRTFNTSKVTDMTAMFVNCRNLATILAGDRWSTASVPSSNSGSMFLDCTSLVGGKGTTYNANHVDKAYAHIDGGPSNPGYFTAVPEAYACYTPSNTTLTFYYDIYRSSRTGTTYDLNNGPINPDWYNLGTYESVTKVVFDPSFAGARPKSTCSWFLGMTRLQSITGMSYLNTSEVTDMESMFCSCSGLTSLDVSNFNTAKVTNMSEMFSGCTNLRTIYVGNGWNTAAVISSNYMFYNCNSLVGGKGTTYDTNHVDKAYAHIDGGSSNPGYFTAGNEAYACYTPSNTTLTFYYDKYRSSRTGTTYNLNEADNAPDWYNDETNYNYNVTKVVFNASFANARPTSTHSWFFEMGSLTSISGLNYLNTSEVTNMGSMFYGCKKLTSLDLRHFNTAKVTDMSSMFYECSGLTSLMLNGWDTSNVTDMSGMFNSTTGLKNLNLSHFNTAEVTDMSWMFTFCTGLTSLDLSNFNTANVTDMSGMFGFCTSLTSLNVSSFNTSGVNNMQTMFAVCSNLNSLDLSNFNTLNVKNRNAMFGACTGLRSLDLSSFNTSNVNNMQSMFMQCSNVTTVTVSDLWSTANVTESENMFTDCTSLVGGKGTTYDANHTDKAYAHIDGGPSNPGYLTEMPIVRGDVNGDKSVNIADVTALIDILLSGATAPTTADCDNDGAVDIADVTVLIDFLLTTPDYYIVGNDPFGNWNPGAGVKMMRNADGSYSYTATVSGTIWFVFASGLSSNWSEFNSNYRFGPNSGNDETVEANTWVNTQHPNIGGDKAYEFVGTGGQYVFTFIPSAGISPTTAKFKINGTVKNPTIETRTVAGEPASVFGTVWDIYNSSNNMTTSSGIY